MSSFIFYLRKQIPITRQVVSIYLSDLIFWVEKPVPITSQVAGTYLALYFKCENRYLELARSQVNAQLYILGEKIGICDQPSKKYMSDFIFWVEK